MRITFWSENLKERVYLGELEMDGRIMRIHIGLRVKGCMGVDWINVAGGRDH
jgi:hypothetical protein